MKREHHHGERRSNIPSLCADAIEGIAFQTNIPALNAAVEAARASRAGDSPWTRTKCARSRNATAAKEIKELIGASVGHVNSGSALVNDAGKTMMGIVQAVKQVADLMGEISAASGKQHTGIEQVMQMDHVTPQNAALVEEASAAAQSMATQSGTLRELVAEYRPNASNVRETARDVPVAQKRPVALMSKKPVPKGAAEPLAPVAKPKVEVAVPADWQSF